MFNLLSGKSKDLLNLYIIFFKISFYKNPKVAEQSLDILFSLMNEIQDVPEWNRTLETFAKAWQTTAPKDRNIVDISKTKKNLLDAIIKGNNDFEQLKLFKQAENNAWELYSED